MNPIHAANSHRKLQLNIEHQSTASLQTNLRNARIHSKVQVRQIPDSIRCFGFVNPVLFVADRMIIT